MSTRKSESRRSKTQRRRSLQVERLENRRLLAGVLELVKDINTTAVDSSPEGYVALGNKVIFTASNAGSGTRALMVTDGTQSGTGFLSTFPQQFNTNPANPTNLVAMGSHVYFSAAESTASLGNQNRELWRTDGTFAGTSRVVDLQSGSVGSNPDFLTVAGGNLFFAATVAASGTELFKYDPSAGTASLVAEIVSGTGSSSPTSLVALGSSVYFVASNGAGLGYSVWKSDGTATGTVPVSPQFTTAPYSLTIVGDKLYYVASDAAVGTELWVTDGASSSAINIRTGTNSSSPAGLKNLDGTLYFTANDGVTGYELYRTSGTLATTERLTDLGAGALDGVSSSLSPLQIGKVGANIVFQIIRPFTYELGFYSLTTGVTTFKDISEGPSASNPASFTTIGSFAYFSAGTQANGTELWRTDGTSSGTTLVSDVLPGANGSGPWQLTAVGNELYFQAWGGSSRQTFVLNTTNAMVRSIVSWPNATSSVNGIKANTNIAYFSANDGASGMEPWRTDGTDAGTFRLADINSTGSSSPTSFVGAGATTFFTAFQSSTGVELWKTDGTVAGTSLVKDINPTASTSSGIGMMTAVGNRVYFMANDGVNGSELWVSDGTANGTQMVANLTTGNGSSNMNLLGQANGKLLFTFNDTTLGKGVELWASGGTAATTGLVKDIYLGASQSGINGGGVTIGQYHYFAATSADKGRELWRTDGTEAGTTLVADIENGSGWSSPSWLAAGGTKLYFSASHAATGNELWVYDTVTQAAPQVVDFVSGTGGLSPTALMATNNQIFFASSHSNGSELWRSDGTVAGTYLVKDINPGASSGLAGVVFNGTLGNSLFFFANNGVDGLELWTSDGTSQGTSMVSNPYGSPDSGYPSQGIAILSSSIVFGQAISMFGHELVKYTPQSPNSPPTDIIMAGGSVPENSPVSTTVATFSSVDPNAGNTFTYSLVAGAGAADNASFSIVGNTLRNNAVFDFETKSSYSIRVRTTDQGGLFFDKAFTISVTNVAEPPAGILVTNNSVLENSSVATTVGSFAALQSDPLTTTFSLVPGALDNAKFSLNGSVLSTAAIFNYEDISFYSVRVTATSLGVTISRDIPIFVGPVNEFDPQLTSALTYTLAENSIPVVNFTATDQDSPVPSFTYSIVGGADAQRFVVAGNRLSFAQAPNFESPADVGSNNEYIVQVAVSDGSRSQTNTLTITVTDVNEAPFNLTLSNTTIAESLPAGSVIGTLGATDLDGPNPVSFGFAPFNPNDNADFQIVGNQLISRREFDYETLADRELLVRIVAIDGFTATSQVASFNLLVTDAPERPVATSQSLSTTRNNAGLPITLSGTGGASLTYTITGQPNHGALTGTGANRVYVPNANFVGTDQFFFTVSNGTLASFQARVEIVVVGTKPTLQFASPSGSDSEGIGTVNIGITLSAASDIDIWIPITIDTVNSTASLDSDFSSIPSSVFVPAGQTSTVVPFSISNDEIDEANEVAIVRIGSSPEFTIGTNATHSLTILDDDLPPTLSLSRSTFVRPESDLMHGFYLQLSSALPQPFTAAFAVTGTATAGSDYESPGTSATIPAGLKSIWVPLKLKQDTVPELPETIVVTFDGSSPLWPIGTTLAQRTVILQITDDDQRIVNMSQSSISVGEDRGSIALKATISPAPTEITRVPFVRSGAALFSGASSDYSIPSPDEFVFGIGQTEATITATIINDTLVETAPESFTLKLQTGSGYVLGTNVQSTVGIVDNDRAILSFSVADITKWEGDPAFNITATLDRSVSSALSIPIVVSLGSGTSYAQSADYSFPFNSFDFGVGHTTSSRSFTVTNDSLKELTEVLTIGFSDAAFSSNSVVARGINLSTRVSINDNDPVVSVAVSNASVTEGISAIYTFTLDAVTNVPTVVPFKISGTSVAGTHHNAPSVTSVTIPAGYTSTQLSISTRDNVQDTAIDPTLTVSIGSVTNATVKSGAGSATVTIKDNDVAIVDFPSADKNIFDLSEARTRPSIFQSYQNRTQSIKVEMSKASDKDIDVSIAFSGKATRNSDYQIHGLTNGKLRIPAGKTSASLNLEILHDTVYEGNETLFMTIDSVSSPAILPTGSKPVRQFGILEDDKQTVTKPSTSTKSSGVKKTTSQTAVPPGTLAIDLNPSTSPFLLPDSYSSASGVKINSNFSGGVGTLAIFTGNQGPIDGATAYFDSNFNLILDEFEPSSPTALDGSFGLEIDEFDANQNGVFELSEGRLVLFGGLDIASGSTWKIPLTAPIGLSNITPISTLVESLIRTQNVSLTDGISIATTALGISNYDLFNSNSLYETLERDSLSAKAYNTHTQLYSTVISIAQLLAGKSVRSVDALGLEVFDQIAQRIAASDASLNLTQPDVVEGIIRSTAAGQLITNLDEATILSAANVIAGGISRLAAIELLPNISGHAYLLSINRAKAILQGSLPDAIYELGAGTKTIAQIESDFTGATLDAKIAAVNATVTVPPAIGIDSLGIVEGNAGQSFLRFSVAVLGEHAYPISTDYFTVDGTATVGSDYTSTTGTLTWPANDNSIKYIDVPILGDNVFEADEFFKVLLTNSNGLVIRINEGVGYILNDEATAIATDTSTVANLIRYTMSSETATVTENGLEKLTGEFANPLSTTFIGQSGISDQFTLDFSNNTFRADLINFNGGHGLGVSDTFTAVAGLFSSVTYSLLGSDSASVAFTPFSQATDSSLSLAGIERSNLFYSESNKLVVRVPNSISTVVIEDADATALGRLRIRSVSNEFSPIEFTNPGLLELHRTSFSTVVTVGTLDPAFSASNIQIITPNQPPTNLLLSNSTIRENQLSSAVVGTLSSTDPEGYPVSYSLVEVSGSSDHTKFRIDGNILRANAIFDFEAKNSYQLMVRVTDTGGLFTEAPFTISVVNELEQSSPVQIGDGTVQRSVVKQLVVSFDQAIEFDAGAFQVFQRVKDSNNALVLVPVTTNVTLAATAGGMTATLTFSGSMTRAGTNALVDGNYQLTINGGLIRILNTTKTFDADGDGNGGGLYTLGNQAADNFFALLGDANGNGEVDAQDLLGAKLALRKTIGQAGYNSAYDINGNSVIDAQDILNIQLNLRKKRVFF